MSTAATVEESASQLQRKFENIIHEDQEMHDRACKGELPTYLQINFIENYLENFV